MKIIKLLTLIVVLAFLNACGTSNDTVNVPGPGSGDTPPSYSGKTPDAGDPGTSTFIANGGEATTSGTGGGGGGIALQSVSDVWVTTSGSVDTSFTVPTVTPVYGGTNTTLTISSNKVATLDGLTPCAGEVPTGRVFLLSTDQNLHYCDGFVETVATGLEVREGYTLTLPANDGSSAHITLTDAVIINGTVTTPDGVSLDISSEGGEGALIQIGTNGLVTTKPLTAGSGASATAGANITLYSSGVTINRGTIDASGSATTGEQSGGSSGSISFTADSDLYNIGTINAKGGESMYVAGGNGGEISIYASTGTVYNSGIINNSGGGGASTGGAANGITLRGGSNDVGTDTFIPGSVIAGGSLTSNSGKAGTGDGSNGGPIQLESNGGKIWSNATINAQGGSSTAGKGGSGGSVTLWGHYGIDDAQTQGMIQVGGTINLSGGYGATGGGDGGAFFINAFDNSDRVLPSGVLLPSPPMVWMKGFDKLDINGGVGATTGGAGGSYMILTSPQLAANSVPVGAIFNQVPVYAKGGTSTTGEGGVGAGGDKGGVIFWQTLPTLPVPWLVPITIISNSGAIDVSGGDGDVGGNSGIVLMVGTSLLENSGVITGKGGGGAGTTTGGKGAYSADMETGIFLYATQTVNNSGAIDISGGAGDTTGGKGGGIMADADYHLWNSAALTAKGGDATTTGGNGGGISLSSGVLQPTSNSGTLSVTGGAPAGTPGSKTIDGIIID